MLRKIFFLSLFFSLSFLHAEYLHVEVEAEGACVMNAKTGALLFEKNAHEAFYPASITKIVTAAVALSKKSDGLDEPITAHRDAVASVPEKDRLAPNSRYPSYYLEPAASHIGIKRGEILSYEDLLHGLLVASGDDAANVIAMHISGTVPVFVEEMNRFVTSLGCTTTYFDNPHGLFHKEQVTTAYEMALIAREAMTIPLFRQIVAKEFYTRPKTNKQEPCHLGQTNRLMRKKHKHYYPHATGGKTGYFSLARHTFVVTAEKGGRELIVVLMKAPTRESVFVDAKKLFEAAFEESPEEKVIVHRGKQPFTFSIDKTEIRVYAQEDLSVSCYPSEESSYKCWLSWKEVALPIQADQCIGRLQLVTSEEEVTAEISLYSQEFVPAKGSFFPSSFFGSWQAGAFALFLLALFLYLRRSRAF